MQVGVDIGLRNFSLCVLGGDEVVRWELVDIVQLSGKTHITNYKKQLRPADIHDIAEVVFPHLFPPEWLRRSVTHFGIESQPGGKYANPLCILLSHLLCSYVRRQMYRSVRRAQQRLHTVRMVGAAGKYRKDWLHLAGESVKLRDYPNRKALSVRLATVLAGVPIPTVGSSKADDLADAYLIARSFSVPGHAAAAAASNRHAARDVGEEDLRAALVVEDG